jgi:hypothetical protein
MESFLPMPDLEAADPEIADLIRREERRQFDGIELIASENYVSAAVQEAMANVMTNKYAEGLPGKRYYGGCEVVDEVERLAIARAKEIFGAEHANVQPHAGAQANAAAYLALLQPGDTVLGMALDQGGHLTHGSKVNFSGKLYNFVPYGVSPETETVPAVMLSTPKRGVFAAPFRRTVNSSAPRPVMVTLWLTASSPMVSVMVEPGTRLKLIVSVPAVLLATRMASVSDWDLAAHQTGPVPRRRYRCWHRLPSERK